MSLFDKLHTTAERLAAAGPGAVPFATVIEAVLGPTEVVIDGRRTLMCGSNNYFGLNVHPEVLAAAHQALEAEGAGTTGSRAANGTYAAHRDLERQFATLFGVKHAQLFTTGYQANLGVIAGLCGPGDTVLVDLESHASIYDGARLSGATLFAFRHNAPDDLRRKLARQRDPSRCLVVIEGLYSISGDLAPVAAFADVCREAGAYLMVDEAHSFGVLGSRGLGRAEDEGALDRVDFIVGTFSKTLGATGGFCVSNRDALPLLHYTSRPYVFTASASPSTIAGVSAALRVIARDRASLQSRLWENVHRARTGLRAAGFEIGATASPIVPVTIGSADRAIAFWRGLLHQGVYVNLMLPPATHPDRCLLRTSYSAAHTADEIDRTVAAFTEVGRALAVLPTPASA
ncbi:MAG: aminotransferase class I/II-fold pyridoxal phosphate-dependent enzyme [Vicinamibacterales bacterium]